MDEHELSFFHLEKEDFNLKLRKGVDAEAIRAPMPMPQAPMAAAPVVGAAPAIDDEAFTSPMVGTFYKRPSPDAENFVEVGATVSEGQTLCIIEAMKVMNEIKAESSGTITAILVDDSTPVQYGDTLFTIK